MRPDLVEPEGVGHRQRLPADPDRLVAATGEREVSGCRAEHASPRGRGLAIGDERLRPLEVEIGSVALAVQPVDIGELRLRLGGPFESADRQQGVAGGFDGGDGTGHPDDVRRAGIAEQELGTVGSSCGVRSSASA